MTTDEAAEKFLAQDLSNLDFSQFKPTKFEFENKTGRINMRLPDSLLKAIKVMASKQGIPYQRFIRQILEHIVGSQKIHNSNH